jgi:transposase-like protein
MEDHPANFQEFLARFKTDEDCWNYLFALRWPDGFCCPKCNSPKYYINNRKVAECYECGHQVSVTSGTIFHGTRKPLLLWFHVMWWVAEQQKGVSASSFKEFMGFGSYETAWAWLHKLRRTMVCTSNEKLSGVIEVDEMAIGCKHSDENTVVNVKSSNKNAEKTRVVVATECLGTQIGRVRFKCIESETSDNLLSFIEENIEHGSTIITNGWSKENPLSGSEHYTHSEKSAFACSSGPNELLPHMQMVDSCLKRWINGTHQGNISPKHLAFYLDEFAFRFDKKLSTQSGKLFYKLVKQAVASPPSPLKMIMKK